MISWFFNEFELRDWQNLFEIEKEKIDKPKEELHNDKLILKRTQEYLIDEQNKFKENYAKSKYAPDGHEKRYLLPKKIWK